MARRSRLTALATALLMAAGSGVQAGNIAVGYGANWVAQAEHGGFYQSVADGTYAACGLDVTIVPGGPGVNNRALMMAGRLDFYMGSALSAFFATEQDVPIVNVMSAFQKDPQVLISHPGRVVDFSDLAGLTMIVADGVPYYDWLKSAYGFTDAQRKTYTFNPAPFLVDEDSAMQGLLSSEPFAIAAETGIKPDVWLLADAGWSDYSTTVQALRGTVETRPEVVSCFVDGSIRGWYTYLYHDRSAADAMILAANPDMTQARIDDAVEAMRSAGIVDSGDAMTLGIGVMTDARMQAFATQMVKAGVIPAGLDIAGSYTLEFVGHGVGLDLRP